MKGREQGASEGGFHSLLVKVPNENSLAIGYVLANGKVAII